MKGEEESAQQDEGKGCVETENCQKFSSELEGERREEHEKDVGEDPSYTCVRFHKITACINTSE